MDKINVDIRTYLCRHTDILEYINADTRTNVQTHVNAYIRTDKNPDRHYFHGANHLVKKKKKNNNNNNKPK